MFYFIIGVNVDVENINIRSYLHELRLFVPRVTFIPCLISSSVVQRQYIDSLSTEPLNSIYYKLKYSTTESSSWLVQHHQCSKLATICLGNIGPDILPILFRNSRWPMNLLKRNLMYMIHKPLYSFPHVVIWSQIHSIIQFYIQ